MKISVGSVIEDSYGNPAIVLQLTHDSKPQLIMQTVGSDCGRRTYAPRLIREITGARAEWALKIARTEWRKQGLKRSNFNH